MTVELKRFKARLYKPGWYVVLVDLGCALVYHRPCETVRHHKTVFGPYVNHSEADEAAALLEKPGPPRFEGNRYEANKRYVWRKLGSSDYIPLRVGVIGHSRLVDAWGPFDTEAEMDAALAWLTATHGLRAAKADDEWRNRSPYLPQQTVAEEAQCESKYAKLLKERIQKLETSLRIANNKLDTVSARYETVSGELAAAKAELSQRPALAWKLEPSTTGTYVLLCRSGHLRCDLWHVLDQGWEGVDDRDVLACLGPLPKEPRVVRRDGASTEHIVAQRRNDDMLFCGLIRGETVLLDGDDDEPSVQITAAELARDYRFKKVFP